MKVKITPSAYLFNKHGKLTYCGRLGNHEKPEELKNAEISKAIEKLLSKDYTYTRTKVYGTSIKFQEDLNLVERVRKRYAQETIYLNYADKRKLNFFLKLSDNEIGGFDVAKNKLSVSVTPYFFNLIDPNNPNCPIRKQLIPSSFESISSKEG